MDFLDTDQPVYIERCGATAYLRLNRADKKNAMTEAMWSVIPGALQHLEHDPKVRVIILASSTEGIFSAGADIAELEAIAQSSDRQESNRQAIREAQRALARCVKPTIAQIGGACLGGGCGLALHCDMRYASQNARFGITPAKLGIVYPLSDTKQLMDIVGPSKAKIMLFTGRIMDASEALSIGLVDGLYPEDQLADKTRAFAQQIAAVSQFSVRNMKKIVRRVLDGQHDDDAATAEIFKKAQEGEDAAEGIRAFLEKRPPVFRWNGDD
jgi:enoyl-CoA hydratase/carnithine racemase